MNAQTGQDGALSVVLLALPETMPATLHALHEVFISVGVVWRDLTGEPVEMAPISTRIVARRAEAFASPCGVPIAPEAALKDVASADIVIVSDLALTPESDPRGNWPEESAWLRARFDEGAIVCSVCTGSVALAESGLLDGIDATSHWAVTRIFARCYPRVKLRPERVLCPAGAGHRIVTSGASSAWSDLALYLIARFRSPAEAVRIAKVFMLGDHGEGQLPFAAMSRGVGHGDAVIGSCQEWLADHYREPRPVGCMVALSGLAERTFKRRFKAATGYTPMDYVQALRIEEAKQMLESTGEPTEAIAEAVGYDDVAFFRLLFRRMTGVSPARYRQRYSVIGRHLQ